MTCAFEKQGQHLLTVSAYLNGDEMIVEQDFARSPRGWLTIRRGMLAIIEKLNRDLENEERCPARPKQMETAL
jgi:hypothetical protein